MWRNKRAALLLEVMVAMVIVATVLTVAVQSMSANLQGSARMEDYARAVMTADGAMFELWSRGFMVSPERERKVVGQEGTGWEYDLKAVPFKDPFSRNLSLIQLDVQWEKGEKKNQLAFLTCLWKADFAPVAPQRLPDFPGSLTNRESGP